MDLSKNIERFNNIISVAYPNIYSVMIYQNGKQIFENYYRYAKPNDRRSIMSCNKSILSAMTGIAIDRGYIKGVDQHILDFFPEYLHLDSDPNILRLRIKHLLTMTTGFYNKRLTADSQPFVTRMKSYDDWVKYILDLPIVNPDLSTFCYSNFEAALLSAIIKKSSGMEIVDFANKYLFSQLGFKFINWGYDDPNSMIVGAVELTTYEMAVLGLLYLNNGYYNDIQIISNGWVEQSKMNYGNSYGFMWWVKKDNIYMASGAGGAMIVVIPNENAVIVSQSKHLKTNWESPFKAVEEYLFFI